MPNKVPSSKTQSPPERLTGKALLSALKKLGASNKTEKARACGYVVYSKSGKERVQLSEFMNELLKAQGIELDAGSPSRRGRSMSYRIKVQKNGILIIGSGYTQEMGWQPGDRFEIKLGRGQVKLLSIDESEDDSETLDGFDDDGEFDDDEIL